MERPLEYEAAGDADTTGSKTGTLLIWTFSCVLAAALLLALVTAWNAIQREEALRHAMASEPSVMARADASTAQTSSPPVGWLGAAAGGGALGGIGTS